MPIYEFRYEQCGKRTTALVMVRDRVNETSCRHCGSHDLATLVSRFAMPKSEDARLEQLSDPSSFAGVDENDPASVARWMKKMGSEMGEDLGDDFEQAVDAEMSGGGDSTNDSGGDQ